jgi:hypothetical protein
MRVDTEHCNCIKMSVDTEHCETMEVEREAIDRFKDWVRGKIWYSGRSKNANKMARILPLYQGFVRDTAEFWAVHFGYSMRGAKPGPLSPMYPLFRDRILLQALTELRDEVKEGVEDMQPLRYVMKRTPRLRDGQPTPRAIYGWVEC